LIDKGYPNLYYATKTDHQYVDPMTAQWQSNVIPGFTTSSKTRPLIVAKMEEFMRNKLITIKSRRLFNEMKTFVWHNGKPQAMKKHNDDLVMACAIGCWIQDTVYTSNQRVEAYQKAFLSSMSSTNKMLNTSMPGMIAYEKVKRDNNINNTEKKYKDFLWLLKG